MTFTAELDTDLFKDFLSFTRSKLYCKAQMYTYPSNSQTYGPKWVQTFKPHHTPRLKLDSRSGGDRRTLWDSVSQTMKLLLSRTHCCIPAAPTRSPTDPSSQQLEDLSTITGHYYFHFSSYFHSFIFHFLQSVFAHPVNIFKLSCAVARFLYWRVLF